MATKKNSVKYVDDCGGLKAPSLKKPTKKQTTSKTSKKGKKATK